MESSSDESFLWTDASSDNSNNMPKKSNSNKQGLDANADHSSTSPESLSDNEIDKLHKGTKKRKQLETPDSTNDLHSGEKQIKLEPESDFEVKKKKARKKDSTVKDSKSNNSILDDAMYLDKKVKEEQESIVSEVVKAKKKKKHKNSVSEEPNDMDWSSVSENMKEINNFLDMKVKEEQVSFIPTEDVNLKKKKKSKSSKSNIDSSNAQSVEGENSNDMESYLNLRVKEEQASKINLSQLKSKKKKKRQSSMSGSENNHESKSLPINSTVEGNDMSACSEQSNIEYSIIDEKFSAEETIIQNPKKKKHEKNIMNYSAIHDTNQEHGDSDTSLQPDFSCNNIVSSTIINTSIDSRNKKHNQESSNIIEDNLLQHKNKLQRTSKISERFRFQDDENSSQEPVTIKLSSKVEEFLRVNSNFQVASLTQRCMVTDDDEIWVLRCPPELDHVKLKDMKLLVDGKCKIKINGQTFDGIPTEGQNRITLLTNHHGCLSVNNFPVKGSVTYRKRIPKTHIPQNVNMINNQTHFIPLPETKCRHPLFGTKYKKAMKIPTEVAKRLEAARSTQVDDSCDNSVKRKKKKQKNKSMVIKEEEKLSPEPEPFRKKRKRELSQDNIIPHKKRKKVKNDPDSAEVWESEKAIEENLFNF